MPAPFTDLIGTDSFTESLRQENLATWLSATNHRFVAELFDGSIAPQVMAGYLVQDYRFLDTFLALIGGAIANADTLAGLCASPSSRAKSRAMRTPTSCVVLRLWA